MDVLYVSGVCSNKKFDELFRESKIKPQQQAQKFHSLLCNGLKEQVRSICVMTALPINRSITQKLWFSKSVEKIGNILHIYLPFINIPIIRNLFIFISGFFTCLAWAFNKRAHEKVIICDILSLSNTAPTLLVAKLFGIKIMAIVTDLPNYLDLGIGSKNTRHSKRIIPYIYRKFCNYLINKYDYYVLLTEQMNRLINPHKKPYVVIEGFVDHQMKNMNIEEKEKYQEKVIVYAGGLYERNGVKKLLDAFIGLSDPHARLWLFGSGELVSVIKGYERIDNRIKYFGVVPNQKVVEHEMKATLLVNPRPSNKDFTKYSFPSKNMEYMVSGTPVLTTALPGMPDEYYNYVYIIDDESVEGLTLKLRDVLNKDRKELYLKGLNAKKFVLDKKNNVIQAKKIISLLKSLTVLKNV
jgi:glycosyltransferase involved in cell wall biosynthesis